MAWLPQCPGHFQQLINTPHSLASKLHIAERAAAAIATRPSSQIKKAHPWLDSRVRASAVKEPPQDGCRG